MSIDVAIDIVERLREYVNNIRHDDESPTDYLCGQAAEVIEILRIEIGELEKENKSLRSMLRGVSHAINYSMGGESLVAKAVRRIIMEQEGITLFKKFRRKEMAELRPWRPNDDMSLVSISTADKEAGSPKEGDMIARNPKNHGDQWLVAAAYFADNFEPVEEDE